MTTRMSSPAELARTYFRAWQDGDFETLAGVIAEDATFRGPLGTADGGAACVEGLRGMSRMMTSVDVKAMVEQGDDVITWFELHTEAAPPAPTANWMHVVDGRIAAIRVTFDPRPLLGAG